MFLSKHVGQKSYSTESTHLLRMWVVSDVTCFGQRDMYKNVW